MKHIYILFDNLKNIPFRYKALKVLMCKRTGEFADTAGIEFILLKINKN